MRRTRRSLLAGAPLMAALVMAACVGLGAGSVWADTKFLDDGAVQNSAGGWDLPLQGTCPTGTAHSYTGIDTRPECVALRLDELQAN